jgi:hypothetical protein
MEIYQMATWKVEKLIVEEDVSLGDVVTGVAWCCYGKNTLRNKTALGAPGTPFVDYPSLSEEVVLSWIWAIIDKGAVEADVSRDVLIAQSELIKPLPWA